MANHLTEKVVDILVRPIGLFENIFGKYANDIAYNTDKEQAKRILHDVYGYTDIYTVCPPQVDEMKINNVMNRIFNYYDNFNKNEGSK